VRIPRLVSATGAGATCAAFGHTGALDIVLVAALVAVGSVAVASGRQGQGALNELTAGVFPMLYLGVPLGALVATLSVFGRQGLLLLLSTIIASDTMQYYSGRLFGRRPLAPRISPKKTIEGALGGLIGGTIAMVTVGTWAMPGSSVMWRVGSGLAIVSAGMVGDLFESMLKRGADMKDSSHLIPGHGGVLDRIDALLFAAPLFYLLALLTLGPVASER
jgi:phosphatidate cytidylyltransferase